MRRNLPDCFTGLGRTVLAPAAICVLSCLLAPGKALAQADAGEVIHPSTPTAPDSGISLMPGKTERWTGDLDGMRDRLRVRILVPSSKTLFMIDRSGRHYGLSYETGVALGVWLNAKYKPPKNFKIEIMFLPVPRDRLISGLVDGTGDMSAGALTITPERQARVAFSAPVAQNVKEVVITGPAAPQISSVEDLAGREIYARRSSSYYEHLASLSKKFAAAGRKPIILKPIDEELEDEDLLDMVNAGLLPWVVVDGYKADLWAHVLPNISVRSDLTINPGGEIAFALRKNSPLLKADLDEFVETHKVGTTFGNSQITRYLKTGEYAKQATSKKNAQKFTELIQIFQKYGTQYSFDYLMVMAQGYQESQLDQKQKSKRGAVGVMQVLPKTAADKAIGIKGIDKSADRNVEAGVKYLRLLVNRYLNDPKIDAKNRTLMAFAAYNAGPGNLNKFRQLAAKSGLNPNVWFQNVEVAAATIVGRETVQYVANIYKYYVAYRLVVTHSENRKIGRAALLKKT
jgi:membrane-bound lytic murein transglycosylase MltF